MARLATTILKVLAFEAALWAIVFGAAGREYAAGVRYKLLPGVW